MKTNERDGFELQLIKLRKRLLLEVDSAEDAIREDVVKPGQVSSVPTHGADADVEGLDAQVAIAMNEESLLEQVEAAIQTFQTGTYGVCQQCGHKIALERLQAIPYTAHCIKCAREARLPIKKVVTGEPRRRW